MLSIRRIEISVMKRDTSDKKERIYLSLFWGDLERNHTTFASGIPHDIVSSICNIESTSTIGTIFTTWTDTIIVLSELCITLTLSLYTLLPPPHNTTQINTDNKYNNNIPIIIIITIANIDNSILRFTIHYSLFQTFTPTFHFFYLLLINTPKFTFLFTGFCICFACKNIWYLSFFTNSS